MTEQQIAKVMEWAVLACKEAENGDMEAAISNLDYMECLLQVYAGLRPAPWDVTVSEQDDEEEG